MTYLKPSDCGFPGYILFDLNEFSFGKVNKIVDILLFLFRGSYNLTGMTPVIGSQYSVLCCLECLIHVLAHTQ